MTTTNNVAPRTAPTAAPVMEPIGDRTLTTYEWDISQTAKWGTGFAWRDKHEAERTATFQLDQGVVPLMTPATVSRLYDRGVAGFEAVEEARTSPPLPAGNTFDGALEIARRMSESTVNGNHWQTIALLQASDGMYHVVPQGSYSQFSGGDGIFAVDFAERDDYAEFFRYQTSAMPWHVTTGDPTKVDRIFPGAITDAAVTFRGVRTTDDHVQALVTKDGFYDLRTDGFAPQRTPFA